MFTIKLTMNIDYTCHGSHLCINTDTVDVDKHFCHTLYYLYIFILNMEIDTMFN